MARQRKLSPERKAFIGELLEHYHPYFEHKVSGKILYVPMGCKEQYKNAVDQSWILENINIPGISRGLINIIEY